MLLVGAGILAAFGVVLAGHALLRGNTGRPSIRGVAQNIGASAWLLPIAAVFGLYVLWMRPSLTTPDETAPVTVPVVAQVDKPEAVETDTKLPDWAKATEHSIGDTQLVVVTGEIGATVDEAGAAGFDRRGRDSSLIRREGRSQDGLQRHAIQRVPGV